MDESIEEINECQGDGCAPELCARLNKQSTFTNANSKCLFSLHVAAQSTMSLFIFLMVFSLLTLAVLFISHQQFS